MTHELQAPRMPSSLLLPQRPGDHARSGSWRQFLRRHSRWSVYGLLLLVIGASIALSIVMEHTAGDIRHRTELLSAQKTDDGNAMTAIAANRADAQLMGTARDVMNIIRLVHLFDLLTLVTAGFMLYHIRARLRIEAQLAHQADHDPLTGLAHRRSFERRLRQLPAQAHTVVLGTIDRFERVVGGFGHAFGDKMMKDVAERIRICAESFGAEVYRLDGANIAILFRTAQSHPSFLEALAALQMQMRTPFVSERHEVVSSLSLGYAEYPRHGAEAARLLKNADAALQAARQAGGDVLVAYSENLNAQADHRLDMETQLRHAVERGELELHYQPQQSLNSNRLIGFEALIRWRRNGELISPDKFIPLAEETGLIIGIGEWILEQACRQAQAWKLATGMDLTMAVNISPRQFNHSGFFEMVERTLADTGIAPHSLELEITEGVMMDNVKRSIELLGTLRRLGLKLSIDDFGTGYSSLAYLKRFPITKLKIDQSFIRELHPQSEDASIVQAVIGLGHNLGVEVIAEGVETQEQREWLRQWSCDEVQGYLYGRPQPAHATPPELFAVAA
ncbi:bifunctional diguanylate cyclase/phosphodiesterase [Herbaspirillum sp. RV1423]|uniref:putative bifunctional diguanylate cyclase/phosphodiesterase n=1 Tax=Herbaspirillum sp. RV1423 TaxID=1443993 RepID=UPI0009E0A1A5|nr:bifunctional diguanylate cyclase/phosphodiesterase [Herbaspirillum sp. RV1423]